MSGGAWDLGRTGAQGARSASDGEGATAASDGEERRARALWSAAAEPGDAAAGALVGLLGAPPALDWVTRAARGAPEWAALPSLAGPDRMRLAGAAVRWSGRAGEVDADTLLVALDRAGGHLVVPGDRDWPSGLADLGAAAPFALWCRGAPPAGPAVAVVGSRASTPYGERVAFDLADGLAGRGVTVVSGGAYGIDAAAHRGSLAGGGPTVVVLAGGVDRAYPVGNARLFEEVLAGGGCVIAESPPGSLPTKSRFLQRNRLIAALAGVTVVVEAAWRSGALSTARHAAELLRPVGAVPGPVTSMASAGCHRLLREAAAVCITDAAEVVELLPAGGWDSGCDGGPDAGWGGGGDGGRDRSRDGGRDRGGVGGPGGGKDGPGGSRPDDPGLDPSAIRVHDALSLRASADVETVARRAGVDVNQARSALGLLEMAGLAVRRGDGWRALRLG